MCLQIKNPASAIPQLQMGQKLTDTVKMYVVVYATIMIPDIVLILLK